MKGKLVILFSVILAMSLINLAIAEDNEKSLMTSSSGLGDWGNAKKINKLGKTSLQVWNPSGQNNNKLNIDYDEIWVWIRNDVFTPSEKKQFKGKFDVHKIYWKNSKVQAFTLEKYYVFNPVSNKKIGAHKITQVWDRDSVL